MNVISKNISKYWFSSLPLLIIIIAFILANYQPLLWGREGTNFPFFKIGFYLCGIISTLWMFQHHTLLFKKGEYLRSLIICVGATVVFLWTYKHKITFRMDLLLLFLCALYSLIYHKWIRPDKVMIIFFLLITLRYIGILWSVDKSFAWEDSFSDKVYFLLLAPIVCLGFRIKEREYTSFVILTFKLFLLLLTLNISIYIFVHKAIVFPFFSFLTLNKGYMDYTGQILAWSFFHHPSFIAWVMFAIWGLSILVWRKDKNRIPLFEIVLYGLFLFCFIACNQIDDGYTGKTKKPTELVYFNTEMGKFSSIDVKNEVAFMIGEDNNDEVNIVQAYQIGKYEVTRDLWSHVYQWATNESLAEKEGRNLYKFSAKANVGEVASNKLEPMANVTFMDAVVWCNALTEYLNFLHKDEKQWTELFPVYYKNGDVVREAFDAFAKTEEKDRR